MATKKSRRHRNVVRAVFDRPWVLLPEKLEAIAELIDARSRGVEMTQEEVRAAIGGEPDEHRYMVAGGTAIIPVMGVLGQRMGMMAEISGGTSTEALGITFDQAMADPSVDQVILHIDSPGGDVFGVQEVAEKIRNSSGKPVIAVVDSLAASGGYWIASAADEIVMTPGGMVGSIGVYSLHRDTSEADEKEGVRTQVVRVPATKAEGVAGEALSDDAVAHRMKVVTERYETFVDAVAQGRGVSPMEVKQGFGQGRLVGAADAMQLGMVDRYATFDQVIRGIGGSSTAKTTPSYVSFEDWKMKPEVFGALVRLGMVTITATEEDATKALARFYAASGASIPQDEDQQVADIEAAIKPKAYVGLATEKGSVMCSEGDKADHDQMLAALRISNLSPERQMELAGEFVRANTPLPDVLKKIGDESAAQQTNIGATVVQQTASQVDKFQEEAKTAVFQRMIGSSKVPNDEIYDYRRREYVAWNPKGKGSYRLASLPNLAFECLVHEGYDRHQLNTLAPWQVAQLAMGVTDANSLGLRASSDGPAYNTTGMFSNLLLDAANVQLRRSYDDSRTTFQIWMRMAESISDFKTVNKVIGGEIGDPRAIPEDGEFEEQTFSDAKETYKLTVWGGVFSISWQATVNDQLGAFTEVPFKQGRAMRRKQNRLAYAVINDNSALEQDSVALFDNSTHDNLTTGANAPSVATLNTMTRKMMEQGGLDSASAALNLMPRFLLAAPNNRGTVLELLGSTANPAAGGSAAGSSGVTNIWQNGLEPIIEAELGDANGAGGSDTAYYLAADSADVDTIEYAYLQGLEAPVLEQAAAFDRLAVRQRIYQAFAVKALDWRGLQKHTGAA